jgi:hypothetical protein
MYETPVGWFFGAGQRILAMMINSWLGFWFPAGSFRDLAGAGHSTESLILAQDERWRRA